MFKKDNFYTLMIQNTEICNTTNKLLLLILIVVIV